MTERTPLELAELYAELGRGLAKLDGVEASFAALTETAIQVVPGAQHASVTQARRSGFVTVGATGELPRQVDKIQYELGSGPCVDAVTEEWTFRSGDLAHDERWPEFGASANLATGVNSMLAVRIYAEQAEHQGAALNLFSQEPTAFDDESVLMATLLATHGNLALIAVDAQTRADNLQRALTSNREIGVAVGVLMATYKIPRDGAFDLLRLVSQHQHRKLTEVAADVADTGAIELPRGG